MEVKTFWMAFIGIFCLVLLTGLNVSGEAHYCGDGVCDRILGEDDINSQFYCEDDCYVTSLNRCGDGIPGGVNEECDWGENNGEKICADSECNIWSSCNKFCEHVSNRGNSCGNGIVEENEECDWGVNNGEEVCDGEELGWCKSCTNNCEMITTSSNLGDECGDDICADDERFGENNYCMEDCGFYENVCGNDIIEDDEECDDGNTEDDDGCSSECEEDEDDDDYHDSDSDGLFYNNCEPNWDCSGWTACYHGLMTRNCDDINYCDYSYGKPSEATSCNVDTYPSITGKVVEDKNSLSDGEILFILIGAFAFLLLVILIIVLLRR